MFPHAACPLGLSIRGTAAIRFSTCRDFDIPRLEWALGLFM